MIIIQCACIYLLFFLCPATNDDIAYPPYPKQFLYIPISPSNVTLHDPQLARDIEMSQIGLGQVLLSDPNPIFAFLPPKPHVNN